MVEGVEWVKEVRLPGREDFARFALGGPASRRVAGDVPRGPPEELVPRNDGCSVFGPPWPARPRWRSIPFRAGFFRRRYHRGPPSEEKSRPDWTDPQACLWAADSEGQW